MESVSALPDTHASPPCPVLPEGAVRARRARCLQLAPIQWLTRSPLDERVARPLWQAGKPGPLPTAPPLAAAGLPALPPVNVNSPLLSKGQQASTQAAQPPPFTFDTVDLQLALTRSRQQVDGGSGLRRAVSAPHSMDALGQEPGRGDSVAGGGAGGNYLAPSGGPMRRVSSSLGMRRSSSFFWTPAAHHEFERAVATLSARGADCSPSAILEEMGHRADLQLADVDKHLRKRSLVQRRVLQTLIDRPAPTAAAGDIRGSAAVVGSAKLAASGRMHAPPQFRTSPYASPPGTRPPVIQEEEPSLAAAAALSESLAHQLSTQKLQHLQLAAAREALLTHERQLVAQPQ